MNFFHHFLELTQNHAKSCRRVKKGKKNEKLTILYSKIIIFWWKTYEKLTFFIIFNLAKTSYERTDWHRGLKFGMWHRITTQNPTFSPPPTPNNFAKTPNERTDWHKHLKFGMWHKRATLNPTISPCPWKGGHSSS